MVATKQQVGHGDGRKKKARLEKMVATTQLRLALEKEEDRRAKKWIELDLDLIWIEIGVPKIQGMCPLALQWETIFLLYFVCGCVVVVYMLCSSKIC